MRRTFSWTLKQAGLCLAATGLTGAALVWAAPKVKGKTPVAPPAPKAKVKTPASKTLAVKATTPKTGDSARTGGATGTKTMAATKTSAASTPTSGTGAQQTIPAPFPLPDNNATPFVASKYPGVIVRNVPKASPEQIPITHSKEPVVLGERKLPDGSSELQVQFPPEVVTLEPKKESLVPVTKVAPLPGTSTTQKTVNPSQKAPPTEPKK